MYSIDHNGWRFLAQSSTSLVHTRGTFHDFSPPSHHKQDIPSYKSVHRITSFIADSPPQSFFQETFKTWSLLPQCAKKSNESAEVKTVLLPDPHCAP